MTGRVEYAVPGWIFALLVNRYFTKDVRRIITCGEKLLAELFGDS
ncbi:MAG: hypothetical protein P8184_08075 [Calditrichia bacterium]